MVNVTDRTQNRLTMQTVEIAPNTTAIRSLDWDRHRFDIEFGLENGTTYNSYVIRGEQTALVDTSHEKFRHLYLDTLNQLIDLKSLDYLIVSHTEPDHSGLVKDVLQLAPDVTVVASKLGIEFLEDMVNQPFSSRVVKNGARLDLGNGHELEFVNAPNLHWPDTMFSFDHNTKILYTCDAFGSHYCSDYTFDEDLEALAAEFRNYYDCLMAPNARSVLSALKRMDELGEIATIANGHGPLLRHNLPELTKCYRTWSQTKAKAETTVAVFYVSDYGYSDRISQAIASGITKTGVAAEMMDLKSAEGPEVGELVSRAAGLVIGMPPASAVAAHSAISTILAAAKDKQAVGLFESYGGDDEPVDPLRIKFRNLELKDAFPAIRIKDTPGETTYKLCEEAGTDLGQRLTRDRHIKQLNSLDADLEKALGRISTGLYIITAKKGEVTGAMVASWVNQASFQPLGLTIAVAKERAIESLMQDGDYFVLNVLEEGNYKGLMKHFLKRFPPGADRFAGVKTQPAQNGSPILQEALSFIECQVVSRLELSDHWLVYGTVNEGRVSKPDALTAVHHRKVGTYY